MIGTILQQGTFTAIAGPTTVKLRSSLDWMKVYDPVNAAAAAAVGFEYFWQRGMAVGTGGILYHAGAGLAVSSNFLVAPLGFTLVDSSTFTASAPVVVTAGTNVVSPVYDTALAGVAVGSIVRISGSAHTNVNGLDFSVGAINAGVSLTMRSGLQQAPGIVAVPGLVGYVVNARLIANNVDEYNHIYPSTRVVCNITQAAAAVVTTLVDHSLTTGQQVRMSVPAICGMIELDGQLATVTVTGVNTFTINIDTTGYTAFAYPLAATVGVWGSWNQAMITPLGGFVMTANQSIAAATVDNDFIGIKLGYDPTAAGLAPAGIAGHVMYWIAGKSTNV